MDFCKVVVTKNSRGEAIIEPSFQLDGVNDLMIRGGAFYAIWDAEKNCWSKNEGDVARLVDAELWKAYDRFPLEAKPKIRTLNDFSSKKWQEFKSFCKNSPDHYDTLDQKVIFSNSETKRDDYATKKLPYPLQSGDISAYEEAMDTWYDKENRQKLEWAIGAIISGDSKFIQKFIVLYGPPKSGKSSFLNIVQSLFKGYYAVGDLSSLGSDGNQFSLEMFKDDPLVMIQHDGDLSRISDNTKLNSIVSHEEQPVNEKFKSQYWKRFYSFIFMGTNKPVKITDINSGINRRLIDVYPTGNKLSPTKYKQLISQISFELGAIADHCLKVYKKMGEDYYDGYQPFVMIDETNYFYTFVEDKAALFAKQDYTTLRQAWELYQVYVTESKLQYPMNKVQVKNELKGYFDKFYIKKHITNEAGESLYPTNYYEGFKKDKFVNKLEEYAPILDISKNETWLKFDVQHSLLDDILQDCLAQYATTAETPISKWADVKTTLRDIQTDKLHYVRIPKVMIVVDFDLKDENGNKSLELNLQAASKWPRTYAELSKSGQGIHLHYYYEGDTSKLLNLYAPGIEIKIFTGNSSLRRKVSMCTTDPVASLNSGLPLKEGGKVVKAEQINSERALRALIVKNLHKEIHPGTKPSIDFIKTILDEAYANKSLHYDVSDMRQEIMIFASKSTHHADYCVKQVDKMQFASEEGSEGVDRDSLPWIIFDVEVAKNLFLICWKFKGTPKTDVYSLVNPTPLEVENLLKVGRLAGFNNLKYDNHILYATLMGYSLEQRYFLSHTLVTEGKGGFREAKNISGTDIFDFCEKKQSLKKWEIELGMHHQEMGVSWDEPIPEELWPKVIEYCKNDVLATEAVWDHCEADFAAREILAALAGGSLNDTTNQLSAKFIFGEDKNPQLVYTNLKTGEESPDYGEPKDIITAFPEYEFTQDDKGHWHNMFRGVDLGFGGYVYTEEGAYSDVALLDVSSLHPHSILAMNYFGKYTKHYKDLLDARIYIKHGEYEKAKKLFDGKLTPYLNDPKQAKALSRALKLALNSCYGLSSAKFKNVMRDDRNVNNIVALRGALFMKTLQDEVAARGFKVAHIKTDSIKIPNATTDIIQFCMDFARKYGYEFEHQATYERMCLVNKAVYIAKYKDKDDCLKQYGYIPEENEEHGGEWTATGAQFKQPYVFKTLFSHEDLEFADFCETRAVQKGSIYLDMNENLPEGDHNYIFVGKVGLFCPIIPSRGGGELLRHEDDEKYYAITGTKDFRWLESEVVEANGKQNDINVDYYQKLAKEAVESISKYCNFHEFVSDKPFDSFTLPF